MTAANGMIDLTCNLDAAALLAFMVFGARLVRLLLSKKAAESAFLPTPANLPTRWISTSCGLAS
jgi:hypothetical protein